MITIAIYHPLINEEEPYFEFIRYDGKEYYLTSSDFTILASDENYNELIKTHGLNQDFLKQL